METQTLKKHMKIMLLCVMLSLAPSQASHALASSSPKKAIDLTPTKTRILGKLLGQCDKVLGMCKKSIGSHKRYILKLEDQNKVLAERVGNLEGRSNHTVLWLLIGLTVGGLATSLVSK